MFILSRKYGRLANRLFNAAHILAFAIEKKHTFVNLSFYDYAPHFETSRHDLLCRYPFKTGIRGNKPCAIILYLLNLGVSYLVYYLSKKGRAGAGWLGLTTVKAPGMRYQHPLVDLAALPLPDAVRVVFFQGWNLRAFDYLEKHGDTVREYFQPAQLYQAGIRGLIEERRKGCEVLAGIVVRHGDYRTFEGGKYFYSIETYARLMQQLTALLGGRKVSFLIFSDEEQDTDFFKNAGFDFFFRSGHAIENLYSLAACDYIISPPSTYGMWASFYGKTPLYIVNDPEAPLSLEGSFEVCRG